MKKPIILLVSLMVIINCNKTVNSENNNQLPKFEIVNETDAIIRYSNVIVDIKGKSIKVPIYGGVYGDITKKDLVKEMKPKFNPLGSLYITAKDGEVKKTFFDILNFYKKNLLKEVDINKPSVIGNEGGVDMLIWYDFDCEGIPCSMMIIVACDHEATSKKIQKMYPNIKNGEKIEETVDMLEFKEDSKWIGISMNIGSESGFKKK